jgi:hypothetical protein
MMTKIYTLFLIFFFLISGCSSVPQFYLDRTDPNNPELLYFSGPPVLYDTDRLIRTPGFWISLHPSPHTLLLTPAQVRELNAEIRERTGAVKDFPGLTHELPGEKCVRHFEDIAENFTTRNYYLPNGRLKKQRDIQAVIDNMDSDSVPETIHLQCGLITTYTHQRILPTSAPLYSIKGEWDFDALQNSALDIGAPVVVAHYSLDKEWAFVYGLRSVGWVPVRHIALCTKEALLSFIQADDFVVLISGKNELYHDAQQTIFFEYARMGVCLPLAHEKKSPSNTSVPGSDVPADNPGPVDFDSSGLSVPPVDDSMEDTYTVFIPARDKNGRLEKKEAYVAKEDCSVGYLPYTPANMIKQAFKLLNAPFGWGGMYGEQDCSRFICGIFATAGIILPRNSRDQSDSGILLGEFEKTTSVEMKENILDYRAVGGMTLLYQQGHVMLYLGMYNHKPYVIHTLWAIARKIKGKNVNQVVNRTVVSTLFLSETSTKGSYLKRLRKISLIDYAHKWNVAE